MPAHDIIDNRSERLIEHIQALLQDSARAKFAVGYFFLSGFEAIKDRLAQLTELKLLIGNTSTRETIEQLAEGYQRLDMVSREAERQALQRRSDRQRATEETAAHLQHSFELMDQTDEAEQIVVTLARLIEEGRVKVRVYTAGRLHAKAYIFDYEGRHDKGCAIVGSSNLTLHGITHNTELNVIVPGNDNHEELTRWFNGLWDESEDFQEFLLNELRRSWAMNEVRPYDIYMKTLYHLVRDRLGEVDTAEWVELDAEFPPLTDFQRVALNQALRILDRWNGVFVADVVGLGKTYIGAAMLKELKGRYRQRGVIVCPAPLVDMWEEFNQRYDLGATVVSMGMLRDGSIDLNREPYGSREVVLIDESHNFRHTGTQRYGVLQPYVQTRKAILLTATPRNREAHDILNQIKLFHIEDETDLPIEPPNLRRYFSMVERGERPLQEALRPLLIRRTRRHIERYYPHSRLPDGTPISFPERKPPETWEYSIDAARPGIYDEIRRRLGRPLREVVRDGKTEVELPEWTKGELIYARYGLWWYVRPELRNEAPYADLHRAGRNLRGLIRTMLFKRFESSVEAFRISVRRLVAIHRMFLAAMDEGFVPAGEKAQYLLYGADEVEGAEEIDLLDALREVSGRYELDAFDRDRLRHDVEADMQVLGELYGLVKDITRDDDAKLQQLKTALQGPELAGQKVLVFSQYEDTVDYLYDELKKQIRRCEKIASRTENRGRIIGRFAPVANPGLADSRAEPIDVLIATDVLSEGLNLQDCARVVNYDLHFNPVRLIQRVGRVDRIGSTQDAIWVYNFLPEREIERTLGLTDKLRRRIQDIHDTIGLDAQVLDQSERLNEKEFYAIYEGDADVYQRAEEEDADGFDFTEAEEMMRALERDNPAYWNYLTNLPDGVRSGMETPGESRAAYYVFCEAGDYHQLCLADDRGNVVAAGLTDVIPAIRCAEREPRAALRPEHNRVVSAVKRAFDREVELRSGERPRLKASQEYVLQQLRILAREAPDERTRDTIGLLDRLYRLSLPDRAVQRLNYLRRNRISGLELVERLRAIAGDFQLQALLDREQARDRDERVPKIVCSESLVPGDSLRS